MDLGEPNPGKIRQLEVSLEEVLQSAQLGRVVTWSQKGQKGYEGVMKERQKMLREQAKYRHRMLSSNRRDRDRDRDGDEREWRLLWEQRRLLVPVEGIKSKQH